MGLLRSLMKARGYREIKETGNLKSGKSGKDFILQG
jgi:hypothetical protein